jgi:hypothetical protein
MDFIDYGPKPKAVNILVRQLGLPKVVVVRTRGNGGV